LVKFGGLGVWEFGSRIQVEEKQYGDIWNNDEYLQFIFERLVIARELMSSKGAIWVHCDWHRSHHLRCLLDEVFGTTNFQNEVIWQRTDPHNDAKSRLGWVHDTLFWYTKGSNVLYNWSEVLTELSTAAVKEYSLVKTSSGEIVNFTSGNLGRRFKLDDCTYKGDDDQKRFNWRGAIPSPKRVWPYDSAEKMDAAVERGEFYLRDPMIGAARCRVSFLDTRHGQVLQTIWNECGRMKGGVEYPTQKPEALLDRIVKACSNPGDLVFDCFMGSGTTQAVAMKLGRRFIGADINLGAIQTTTKRLLKVSEELGQPSWLELAPKFTGFEVYNVNYYDVFRNPLEAKALLMEALEITKLEFAAADVFDGEKDGRKVKIMPINRIATRADLAELIAGFDYRAWQRRQEDKPGAPVERILLVCMGHEPDLGASLALEVKPFRIDVEVVDVLRDKAKLEFKRDANARLAKHDDNLVIERFYPMNLLQKLSLQQEDVRDWRELVESVMLDFNFDGAIFNPTLVDLPSKNELVRGSYAIPADAGTIKVKITDLLSESWEGTLDVSGAVLRG
jgi:adenine-specific DNA-methyltransferase